MNVPHSEPEELTCIICEQQRKEGIVICGQLICEQCEQEMLHTDVLDEKYPFFITQMKRVWYRKNA